MRNKKTKIIFGKSGRWLQLFLKKVEGLPEDVRSSGVHGRRHNEVFCLFSQGHFLGRQGSPWDTKPKSLLSHSGLRKPACRGGRHFLWSQLNAFPLLLLIHLTGVVAGSFQTFQRKCMIKSLILRSKGPILAKAVPAKSLHR